MAEYAGYVGNQVPPTDWGKIGTQLFDQYNKINEDRKVEKEKIENDFSETFQKIGEYESTTDQTTNEYLYKGVDEARNALKTQYDLLKKGAITMADYKLKKNTLMADWGNVSKALKNNAGIMESIQKMNASGKMSGFGRYRSEKYGKQLDIKDGKLYVNPDTLRIYGAKVNPKTGLIDSPSNVYSPVSMINQYNIVDEKVDLNDGVTEFLKRVSDYGIAKNLGGGRIELTENARQNPSYTKALDAQVNAMTVTPFKAASVLIDYAGGYQSAETEAERKELIASGVAADKIISAERVNGVLTPKLTPDQQKAAQVYVRDQIEVGVGQKETMTPGHGPVSGGRPTVDSIKEQRRLTRNMNKAKIANAFMDPSGGSEVFGEIKKAAVENGVRQPVIVERPDGTKVLKGIPRGKQKQEVIQEFTTNRQAYAYLEGNPNVLNSAADFDEAMQYAEENGFDLMPAKREEAVFDMVRARELSPGLSDQEIKANIIKQNPGKRLIWKDKK
jgi:hypothetical protein